MLVLAVSVDRVFLGKNTGRNFLPKQCFVSLYIHSCIICPFPLLITPLQCAGLDDLAFPSSSAGETYRGRSYGEDLLSGS